jgi:hypothetical protein
MFLPPVADSQLYRNWSVVKDGRVAHEYGPLYVWHANSDSELALENVAKPEHDYCYS